MPNGHLTDISAHAPIDNPWSRVKPKPRQRPDPCEEPCTPRCPACGGLKCLCRPRFFPGQLLTDEDLNRLEQYVLDKNRLHNRYLHGWGVACGLEVVCDRCDPGHVIVRTGYALSPCGDDIIVCSDYSVDVCALIDECEPRDPVCAGPYEVPPRDCRGGVKKWVLAICYDERPVRGVTPQLGAGDSAGHGKCKCGGSGACGCGGSHGGCGCGGNGGGKTHECSCGGHETKTNGRKPYKPQCEPTQICEGYRFIIYPAPADVVNVPDIRDSGRNMIWAWMYANRARFGPLIERLLCCVTRAMELIDSIKQGRATTPPAALVVYTDYASMLAEFAADFAIHRCAFVARAGQLRDEAGRFNLNAAHLTNDVARLTEISNRLATLNQLWLEIVSECFCSALLPGCPKPAATNCVPLAVVTLADGECRVIDICNWSQRKILISWPTITYWLSWLPWHRLSAWIAGICCGPNRNRDALTLVQLLLGLVFSSAASKASAASTAAASGTPMMSIGAVHAAGAGAAPVEPLEKAFESDDFLAHMLGNFNRLRTEGSETTTQPAWAGFAAGISEPSALWANIGGDRSAEALTRRLDAAEKTLLRQADEIKALKNKVRK